MPTPIPIDTGGAALEVRKPLPGAPPLHRVPLPPPLVTKRDVVALLLEERQGER